MSSPVSLPASSAAVRARPDTRPEPGTLAYIKLNTNRSSLTCDTAGMYEVLVQHSLTLPGIIVAPLTVLGAISKVECERYEDDEEKARAGKGPWPVFLRVFSSSGTLDTHESHAVVMGHMPEIGSKELNHYFTSHALVGL
jgi:hypothetical protein